jgi:hypothetical protein
LAVSEILGGNVDRGPGGGGGGGGTGKGEGGDGGGEDKRNLGHGYFVKKHGSSLFGSRLRHMGTGYLSSKIHWSLGSMLPGATWVFSAEGPAATTPLSTAKGATLRTRTMATRAAGGA